MSGGMVTKGRKRAVTVSIVTHDELLREVRSHVRGCSLRQLRPGSKEELKSLLELCEATLTAPPPQMRVDTMGRGRLHASVGNNGKVHYIKYRHAPFHALMSILSKLRGRDSPAYWDIFRELRGLDSAADLSDATSRAIVALSTSLKSRDSTPTLAADAALMTKMVAMFDRCFGAAARPIQL